MFEIKISKETAAAFEERRQKLARQLQDYEAAEAAIHDLSQCSERLAAEVARLEQSTSYNDTKAVAGFATKRAQLDLMRGALAKLQAELPEMAEALGALGWVRGFFGEALVSERQRFLAIAKQEASILFTKEETAEQIASRSDACQSFGWFLGRDWLIGGSPKSRAALVLAAFDALLNGRLPFKILPR